MKKSIQNQVFNNLKNNGYAVVNNCLSFRNCKSSINHLNKICSKNIKNKEYFSVTPRQLTIKDLVFRDFKNFSKFLDIPIVLNVAKEVFKDEFILDNFIASKSVNNEGNKELKDYKKIKKKQNIIHMDGHLPMKEFSNTTDLIIIICLNDFNKRNGSTRVWPKSHMSGKRINHLKTNKKIEKNFKTINAKSGSIIFFLGQTWHQIGENLSGNERWGLIIHYKRWWIKPSLDYTKCGKKIYRLLNTNQKKLFGFNSISPKFDFKLNYRKNLKTKRDILKVPKNYNKALNY
ncbi:phytanoyl-CoA dioxygenase family protein [Candidatus Pelagibacter bacterium]|nr:phytanoyl-CoA dioxygenase family protein [Candidatus Pelagibacter bacterium]